MDPGTGGDPRAPTLPRRVRHADCLSRGVQQTPRRPRAAVWNEIAAAARELRSAPARRGAGRRSRRRVAAAVAAWAKTILEHAREVAEEAESRFESARARRLERLAPRRIADSDESRDENDENDENDETTIAAAVPLTARTTIDASRRRILSRFRPQRRPRARDRDSRAAWCTARFAPPGVWWRVRCKAPSWGACPVSWRAPPRGSRRGGERRVRRAGHRVRSYGTIGDVRRTERGRRRTRAPPRGLDPLDFDPEAPPASLLEPILPYNGVEASARQLQAFAAKGRFAREQYVGGASLTRPRGAFVAVTSRRLLVGIAVASSAEDPESEPTGNRAATTTGAASWLTREALPHGDIIEVETDREDARGGRSRAPRRAPTAEAESTDAKRAKGRRRVAHLLASEEKVADEDADETPKDAATNEGFGDGTGVGIREVALYCSDEAAARALCGTDRRDKRGEE